MKDTLGILLAGGAGERLYPLTRDRAKPAVTFGGIYRIIDITLSNCVNSGLRRVFILTQYKALSLNRQIREGWNIFGREIGEFIEILPPMKRVSENWYMGTADAVYQNIYSIGSEQPKYVLILSGDHIYKMNYERMLKQHKDAAADVTVATLTTDPDECRHFGVVDIDHDHRITGFLEKPQQTDLRSPYDPTKISASMGIYIFNTDILIPVLLKDAEDPNSSHDFGKNILPKMLDDYCVFSFNFVDENKKEALYWRDVGTLDAYYEANIDLVSVSPVFNLYDEAWPISASIRRQNSCLLKPDAWATPSIRWFLPAASFPAAPSRIAYCLLMYASTPTPKSRTVFCSRTSTWDAVAASAKPSSTATYTFPKAPPSATIPRPTANNISSPTAASPS